MKTERFAIALTAINLLLLAFLLARASIASPKENVLRANRLELVDEHGRVRSSLKIESDGAVLLRLMDQEGRIRVKLGAGNDGSGLLLADETTEPGIHMIARRKGTAKQPNTTSITLQTAGGKREIRP